MSRGFAGCLLLASVLASCKTTPTGPLVVDVVEVSPGTLTLGLNESHTLTATPKAGSTVLAVTAITWSSSNPQIVSVDPGHGVLLGSAQVLGVAGGSATISATIDGKTGTSVVTVNNPVPTTSALAPSPAPVGGPAFTLTVTGTNFVSGSVVRWNGAARSTTFGSATQLTAELPAADIAAAGTAQVTVFNPPPGGGESAPRPLTIANPTPVAAFLEPRDAIAGEPVLTVTVNGSGFLSTSEVRWNGTARATSFVSATQLLATIPAVDLATATTAQVTVFNPGPGGGSSSARNFTVTPVMAIALGDEHACGVKNTGVAYCWGDGEAGQLGNGGTDLFRATPITVGGGLSARQVSVGAGSGNKMSCLVSTVNQVSCWGLGLGGPIANSPTLITSQLFRVLRIGTFHVCGLAITGEAFCWGSGSAGQIGNGSLSAQSSPAAVSGGLKFATLSTRGSFTCGLTGAGAAWCWGAGANGALGNGASANSAVPVPVSGGLSFDALSVGLNHACALTVAGAAYCWGQSTAGQLGNGSLLGSQVPVPVSGGLSFASISAGSTHTCAISLTGAAYCWGEGKDAELGDGLVTTSSVPVAVAGGLNLRTVVAGRIATCGITTAEVASCWGTQGDGILGSGLIAWAPAPVAVSGGLLFTSLTVGNGQACAVTAAGQLYCWGQVAGTDRSSPVLVPGPQVWLKVFGHSGTLCGITTTSIAWCWGAGGVGQLGNGAALASNVPVPVSGGLTWNTLAAGPSLTCGVTTANALYCWGLGALDGVAFQTSSNVPVLIPGGGTYTDVAVGDLHQCALQTSGAAFCWGTNSNGQLGDGTNTARLAPSPATGSLLFTRIGAGVFHTCAIATTNKGYCWGNGVSGQVGNGTSGFSWSAPQLTIGGFDYTVMTGGFNFSCALATGGGAQCWGAATAGQLGTGVLNTAASPGGVSVPTPVTGGVFFTTIASASLGYSCGLDLAGAAWCWGRMDYGGLGNGIFGYATVPGAVLW